MLLQGHIPLSWVSTSGDSSIVIISLIIYSAGSKMFLFMQLPSFCLSPLFIGLAWHLPILSSLGVKSSKNSVSVSRAQ